MTEENKPGRPFLDPKDGPRKRFQAMVANSTIEFFKKHEWPGRKLDEMVKREKEREEFDNES